MTTLAQTIVEALLEERDKWSSAYIEYNKRGMEAKVSLELAIMEAIIEEELQKSGG